VPTAFYMIEFLPSPFIKYMPIKTLLGSIFPPTRNKGNSNLKSPYSEHAFPFSQPPFYYPQMFLKWAPKNKTHSVPPEMHFFLLPA